MCLEAKVVLKQLIETISQLTYDEYTKPLQIIGVSTIGEHTRHIIELFVQLMNGYESGVIDYDNRARNKVIQTNIDYAIECIAVIIHSLNKENKSLSVTSLYTADTKIQSSYLRELMYNIEHCIHHQAIIKIGLIYLGKEIADESFGVAKSTKEYKSRCVQ